MFSFVDLSPLLLIGFEHGFYIGSFRFGDFLGVVRPLTQRFDHVLADDGSKGAVLLSQSLRLRLHQAEGLLQGSPLILAETLLVHADETAFGCDRFEGVCQDVLRLRNLLAETKNLCNFLLALLELPTSSMHGWLSPPMVFLLAGYLAMQ